MLEFEDENHGRPIGVLWFSLGSAALPITTDGKE
jgi:hypothetical protein